MADSVRLSGSISISTYSSELALEFSHCKERVALMLNFFTKNSGAQQNEAPPTILQADGQVLLANREKLTVLASDIYQNNRDVKSLQASLQNLLQCQTQQTLVANNLRDIVRHMDKQVSDWDTRFNDGNLPRTRKEKMIVEDQTVTSTCVPSQGDSNTAITVLKELCWQVTTLIYRVIFHESHSAKRRYSFHDMRSKIDRLKEDQLKQQKNDSLNELTQQIGWTDDMEDKILQLLEGYELHTVQITPFELNSSAVDLIFKSDILLSDEVETVRKLVKIWQSLSCCGC